MQTIQGQESALFASFSSIMVSEIGDKTFFIAAIMAIKYSRTIAFLGSYSALFVQTFLSCIFGFILPQFLPKLYTEALACLLFFFFGAKLVYTSLTSNETSNEQEEVEQEIEKAHKKMVQSGHANGHAKSQSKKDRVETIDNMTIFAQAFILTFLAEWGDRSQITTIALSASGDALMVFIGAASAHCVCTGASVLAGKLIAKRITEQMINLVGGCLFLIFGITTTFSVYYQYLEK